MKLKAVCKIDARQTRGWTQFTFLPVGFGKTPKKADGLLAWQRRYGSDAMTFSRGDNLLSLLISLS